MKEMKTQLILFSLLLLGSTAWAQQPCLSQEAYREKVEAYSQILKQQKLKTLASSEARKIAHTGFLPKIDVNADGTLNMSDLSAWNEPVGEYRNHTYQGVFVVSQPLYTGGALNAQHQIAKADEKLNQLNEELTLDQIHYQSDAVYWNASASKAMLQAADKYQSIVKQQYDIIQDRFDDGMISRTDLLMISTRLKEAELQYIKARQNYTLALQQLNILMGEAPNTPVDSLYNIGMISAPVRILPLEDVLQRRADYASTEVNIMKSQAQRKAALSQFNPQLNMYFSGGWATATPNLGYDVSFNPIVGVNLNIPIFRQFGESCRQFFVDIVRHITLLQLLYSDICLLLPVRLETGSPAENGNTKVATELYDGQYQRRTVGSSHQTDGNRISGENSERKHESGK